MRQRAGAGGRGSSARPSLIGLGALAYGKLSGGAATVETAAVTAAYPSQAVTLLNATGYVVAQRKAAVASKATGRLEWLGVQEGSRAEARRGDRAPREPRRGGEPSRPRQREGVARQPRAGARRAARSRARLERSRDLAEKKLHQRLDARLGDRARRKAGAAVRSGEAAVNAAQANLKAAEVAVDQTLIRAPFDGVVLTKSANVGDNITPFSSAADTKGAVVTIADMETLEVEADVAEILARQGEGRAALRDPARCAAGAALRRRGAADRADGGPRQGDRAGEDPAPRARPARAARHERPRSPSSSASSARAQEPLAVPNGARRAASSATGRSTCSW